MIPWILILLGGLAFLFPVAVYCIILATLNRQKHPVMVSGGWDFAQMIFGCSGFLVFGGPAILSGFSRHWRSYWLTGRRSALTSMGDEWWLFWMLIWGIYFAAVIGFVTYMIYRRQRQTEVYNVEVPTLHECIGLALDRLGYEWKRDRQSYLIGPRAIVAVEAGSPQPLPAAPRFHPGDEIELAIDSFPAMRHCTLHWPEGSDELRQHLEDELAALLGDVQTHNNPVGTWLLWIGGLIFFGIFFSLVFVITLNVLIFLRR